MKKIFTGVFSGWRNEKVKTDKKDRFCQWFFFGLESLPKYSLLKLPRVFAQWIFFSLETLPKKITVQRHVAIWTVNIFVNVSELKNIHFCVSHFFTFSFFTLTAPQWIFFHFQKWIFFHFFTPHFFFNFSPHTFFHFFTFSPAYGQTGGRGQPSGWATGQSDCLPTGSWLFVSSCPGYPPEASYWPLFPESRS